MGTECGRRIIHPSLWVNSLFTDYKPIHKIGLENHTWEKDKLPNWVITDLRFPNEIYAIREKSGLLLRINRIYPVMKETDNGNDTITLSSEDPNFGVVKLEHESETALDNYNFDYTITNDGTIEDLIDKVRSILISENII